MVRSYFRDTDEAWRHWGEWGADSSQSVGICPVCDERSMIGKLFCEFHYSKYQYGWKDKDNPIITFVNSHRIKPLAVDTGMQFIVAEGFRSLCGECGEQTMNDYLCRRCRA